jgi:PAS domain S-box-containing protein
MERMMMIELDSYMQELKKALAGRLSGKLDEDDIKFLMGTVNQFIEGLIKVMRERKSVHEKYFSDIILNSPDAIIGFDKKNEIFLWNNGAVNLFGYAREEAIGKDFGIIIPDKIKEKEQNYCREKFAKADSFTNYETIRCAKNGDIKNVSISSFKILNEEKEFIGNVSIIRDFTLEKSLERELRNKENLALIGTVVSTIAHNLSNPLNIISGNADYLLLDRKENDEGYEELQVIVQETTRITKSIRQILNFSKPVILTKEKCNINSIVKEILGNAQYYVNDNKKSISFKSDIDESIGEILIDKDQIKDVLLNIVNNAIQAIKDNGTVRIKTLKANENKKEYVVIKVEDNGSGINKDDLKNIFVPFFSTKEFGKGTGLGLAFSDRVVREHSGFIKVDSEVGKGTVFSVYLPA